MYRRLGLAFAAIVAALTLIAAQNPQKPGTPHVTAALVESAATGGVCGTDQTCDLMEVSFTTTEGYSSDLTISKPGVLPSPGATTGSVSGPNLTPPGPPTTTDAILLAANNASGAGGRGYRHYRSGTNTHGGGLKIIMDHTGETEIWFRYYIRWASGMSWVGGNPHYTKDWYQFESSAQTIIGHQGGAWGFNISGGTNYPSSVDWQDQMGGTTSDGQFHCHEYHFNTATNVAQMWIDDTLVMDRSDISWGIVDDFQEFFTSNHDEIANGEQYTDYDDIAVSTVGRIGCF